MNDEEKIIQDEINRLDICLQDAYGRYELTGSRATEKRITRLRVIQNVLKDALTGSRTAAREQQMNAMARQLDAVRRRIDLLLDSGLITHNVARDLTETINTVGKEHR